MPEAPQKNPPENGNKESKVERPEEIARSYASEVLDRVGDAVKGAKTLEDLEDKKVMPMLDAVKVFCRESGMISEWKRARAEVSMFRFKIFKEKGGLDGITAATREIDSVVTLLEGQHDLAPTAQLVLMQNVLKQRAEHSRDRGELGAAMSDLDSIKKLGEVLQKRPGEMVDSKKKLEALKK